jgi:hypothetical protein
LYDLTWREDFVWKQRITEAGYCGKLVRQPAVKWYERLVWFNLEAGAGDIGKRGPLPVVKDVYILLVRGRHVGEEMLQGTNG